MHGTRTPLDRMLIPLAAAGERIVSTLAPLPAPPGCPLHARIAGIKLTAGCEPPPGPGKVRAASGWGWRATEAELRTIAEASERYSVQYRRGDPEVIAPVSAFSSCPKPVPSTGLLLGHPGAAAARNLKADSRGCAAGASLAEAALHGLLELVETYVKHHWREGEFKASGIHFTADGPLRSLNDWLRIQGRRINVLRLQHTLPAEVAACVMSERDGSRLVLGTAANLSLQGAIHSAVGECFLLWRNLEGFVHSQPEVGHAWMSDEEAFNFHLFKQAPSPVEPGFLTDTGGAALDRYPADEKPPAFDAQSLFFKMRDHIGCEVFVYDFTRSEVGIPVARVVCPALHLPHDRR